MSWGYKCPTVETITDIDTCHKTSHWIIYQIIIMLLLQIYYTCGLTM